jgi:ABC-type transport system substrate-binding protein
MCRRGAIDIAEYIVPTDAKTVEGDKRLKLVVSDALRYYGITNNLANGPRANTPYGKDPLVRKAFELSIDRDALIGVVFNGLYPASAQATRRPRPITSHRSHRRRAISPRRRPCCAGQACRRRYRSSSRW